MTEDIISFRVRLAMKVDPALEAVVDQIDVHNEDGFITLSGTVPTHELAQAAEQITVSVADVRGVHNNIGVAGGGEETEPETEQTSDKGMSIDQVLMSMSGISPSRELVIPPRHAAAMATEVPHAGEAPEVNEKEPKAPATAEDAGIGIEQGLLTMSGISADPEVTVPGGHGAGMTLDEGDKPKAPATAEDAGIGIEQGLLTMSGISADPEVTVPAGHGPGMTLDEGDKPKAPATAEHAGIGMYQSHLAMSGASPTSETAVLPAYEAVMATASEVARKPDVDAKDTAKDTQETGKKDNPEA